MRTFDITYFGCEGNEKYHNLKKNYTSYFLSFPDNGCRIELMNRTDITNEPMQRGFMKGIAHFDVEVGEESAVNVLVERL